MLTIIRSLMVDLMVSGNTISDYRVATFLVLLAAQKGL